MNYLIYKIYIILVLYNMFTIYKITILFYFKFFYILCTKSIVYILSYTIYAYKHKCLPIYLHMHIPTYLLKSCDSFIRCKLYIR